MHTRRPAFTIIELMVVIVIISLLTAVATTSFVNAQRSARDNARKTTVGSIATAIESYYRDNHAFPGAITGTSRGACEKADSDTTISYSYVPKSTCMGTPFLSTDTAPTWIPGLGTYMSSAPIDKRFLDAKGLTYDQIINGSTQTIVPGEVWTAKDGSISNVMRTYTYRHLNGGYIVYTRLEGSSSDTVSAPLTGTGSTVLGTDPTGGNVYAIKR